LLEPTAVVDAVVVVDSVIVDNHLDVLLGAKRDPDEF
jgi:hypothetical protein